MKLLTAAVDSDPDGFTWTVPGELVTPASPCDVDGDEHDPAHECLVAFTGLASGRGCTVARVADVDVAPAQLLEVVREHWRRLGVDAAADEARQEAAALLDDAAPWPVGALLRRYDDELQPA